MKSGVQVLSSSLLYSSVTRVDSVTSVLLLCHESSYVVSV
ncbi:unnamed protein product [Brassica oleracea]